MCAEQTRPHIAVIGGGIAGLTAAYRLHQAGLNVDLYEARGRVGGRILSVKIHNKIGELGAQNILDGGDGTNILRLVKEFGLKLIQSQIRLNHYYFSGEELIPVQQLPKDMIYDPQSLKMHLTNISLKANNMSDILRAFFAKENYYYKSFAARLAAYEGNVVEDLSPLSLETFYYMLLGGLSLSHQKPAIDFLSIKGGNSLLPNTIAEALGEKVHLQMPLSSLQKNPKGRYLLTFQNGQIVQADILLLAIPCSVYQDIHFAENVIPEETLQAIRNVQYGTNAKILVPFPCGPQQQIGLIHEDLVSFFDSINHVLTLYFVGNAGYFSKDTILENYLLGQSMIEKGYQEKRPDFSPPDYAEDISFAAYERAVGYSWPGDPYAKGSYSSVAPGQEEVFTAIEEIYGEKSKTLFAPLEQTLFFAGEHTSVSLESLGTMEGACESGERAARIIQKIIL
ncbi:MAG: hypothetical protein Tsb0015_09720 [Simkaniaceae bacterium]